MNALDYLAYQEDMREAYEADYDLWILQQECDYHEVDYISLLALLLTLARHTDSTNDTEVF